MDIPQRRPTQADRRRDITQTVLHKNHICGIDRDISARSDGYADVSTGQRRSIVDAVTDHGYSAFFLQLPDHTFLSVRKYSCNDFIHSGLCTDGSGGPFIVSGQHYHMNSHIPQLTDGTWTVFLNYVCHRNDSEQTAVTAETQGRLAFFCQLFRLRLHEARYHSLTSDKLHVSAKQYMSFANRTQSVAGERLKFGDFRCRKPALLRL